VVEASGGITEETIQQYLSEHVDVVSIGKLTQGYSVLDFSLKIDRQQAGI
jgi:nicotinate-nucleotide pyrophosphorylase (carboxylating)